jgi:hypothetical protein
LNGPLFIQKGNKMTVTVAEKREMFRAELEFVHDRYRAYWAGELDGYCIHGVYVGGSGIDWMCGICESGEDLTPTEWAMANVRDSIRRSNRVRLEEMQCELLNMLEDDNSFSEKAKQELWKAWVHLRNGQR